MRLLREGATMIVDAVDEMHGPIGILAENLTGELHEEVQVNAYASWGTRAAYGPHYDEHDVFVVQVAGEKRWQVFESVSDSRAGEDGVVGGTNKVFDRVIRSGDVIYLPRGWMHDVVAVDKPSLHLTIGIRVRNGLDLLTWLMGQCQDAALFNRRLPRFRAGLDRSRHIEMLRQEFERLWETDGLLQRFFDDWDTHIPARMHFSLPWIGRDGFGELSDTDYLRLSGTSWRCVRANGAEVAIEADGGTWLLPAPAERVLRRLSGGNRACVGEIIPVVEGDPGKDQGRELLTRMVREGLLYIDAE
jgi:Cupin superfamily protein